MSEPERLDEVGRWLGYAGEDLRAARALMKLEDMPRQVCFHAELAVEGIERLDPTDIEVWRQEVERGHAS